MKIEMIKRNNVDIAVVKSDTLLITDVQSALDFLMTVKYQTGCANIAVNKEAVTEDSSCSALALREKFCRSSSITAQDLPFTEITPNTPASR